MNSQFDIASRLKAVGNGGGRLTAGGAGDNTQQNGGWADRSGFESAMLVVFYRATLAQGATLSIAALVEDATSNAGAGAAAFGNAVSSGVVATGGAGGSTEVGAVTIPLSLQRARQFLRGRVTPDLSAGATDTAELTFGFVFGSGRNNPPAGYVPPAL